MLTKFIGTADYKTYADFKQNFHLTYSNHFNFAVDVVDDWAKTQPNRIALRYCDDHQHELNFTFADISCLSKKTASYLHALGIEKGDRVMLQLKRRWEYWVTAVALHRIGAVLIPASFQLTAKDLIYRANAAQAKMIICAPDDFIIEQVELARPSCTTLQYCALVGSAREGWINFSDRVKHAPADFIREESQLASDPMLLYFTSGTTGMPKMVLHDFTYPLGHIVTAKYWQKVEDGGLHLTVADSGWAKFGWGSIYGQWISGSALLGYDADNKFSAKNLLNVLTRYQPTTMCVPGTIYRFLMKEELPKEAFSSLKHCCTAGEPLAPEITRQFKEQTGLTIHEGYGQSESSVMIANFGDWFPPRLGSMGKPSPLYNLTLIKQDGRKCEPGEQGEIVIQGLDQYKPEGLLCSYYDHQGNFISAYDENHMYHTGDLAYQDEDGYFWFVGRNDDMIKCSAYRIGPFEIESVLLKHPAVFECAITGAPDPIRGQVVCATIVLQDGVTPSEELTKDIQTYVKHMTAPYKYPRVIHYVSSLPKTTSGKISRKLLREKQPM